LHPAEYFLGPEKAGNTAPPNLLGFPVLFPKGTFNPPLWQLTAVPKRPGEFTLTVANSTFSKTARLAYDATQCLSDTAILSDKGGNRWKLKNGVLTAAVSTSLFISSPAPTPFFFKYFLSNFSFFVLQARTNCTKVPGSNLILGLSSKGAASGLCSSGVILNPSGSSKSLDTWSLKLNKPPPPTTPIKLYGDQTSSFDNFGQSVGVQGTVIAVGGRKEAFLFTRPTTVSRNWSRYPLVRPSTVPSTSNFGESVAADGNLVLVGASGGSSAAAVLYIINNQGQVDSSLVVSGATSNAKSPTFGTRVALSGSTLAISSPGDNAVYLYTYEKGEISKPKVLIGNSEQEENFGRLLALSESTLAIASTSKIADVSGSVTMYTKKESFWSVSSKLSCPATFGENTIANGGVCPEQAQFPNLNIALYGQTLAISHAGSVFMYDRLQEGDKDAGWTQKQSIATTSPLFGASLALYKNTLLAGGDAAKVIAYARTADFPAGEWEKSAEMTAPEGSGAVGFGKSGAGVYEDQVVIGAEGSSATTPKSNGMAFIFRNPTMQYILT
jgi:hypothetical protein